MDLPVLSEIFASKARVSLIETLRHQPGALSLRELSDISNVPLRSAQLALRALEKQRIVSRRRVGNRVHFQARRDEPIWTLLSRVLHEDEKFRIARRAESYQDAERVLKFAASAARLLASAHSPRS